METIKTALRLLLFSISQPPVVPKTKAQAEQLALTLKEQLTTEEIESAQAFAENTSLEILVNELLRRIGKGTISKFPV